MLVLIVVETNICNLLQEVPFLLRKQIFVYKNEDFAIHSICPSFPSYLLTCTFPRGVTEKYV